jgi:hypothetical protein
VNVPRFHSLIPFWLLALESSIITKESVQICDVVDSDARMYISIALRSRDMLVQGKPTVLNIQVN